MLPHTVASGMKGRQILGAIVPEQTMTEVPWSSRPPASVRRRVVAYLLDSIAVAIVAFAAAWLVAAVVPALSVSTEPDGSARLAVDPVRLALQVVATTAVSGAYFVLSWAGRWKATPGQRLLGMVVATEAGGSPLSASRSLVRWVALGAPFGVIAALVVEAPMLWLLVVTLAVGWAVALLVSARLDARRRGIHDRIAGSLVVR